MKYYNLVYAKHHETDRRAYLFSPPLDKDIHSGDRIYVRDKLGDHVVKAFGDNWYCSERMTETICKASGGYYPPASVVGTVDTVTIRQDVVNTFEGETTEIKEEEAYEPWF